MTLPVPGGIGGRGNSAYTAPPRNTLRFFDVPDTLNVRMRGAVQCRGAEIIPSANAKIAQLAERHTRNVQVWGSIPHLGLPS